MTFFCTWRAAFHKWFFGFPAVFHLIHVEPIFPSSGSFSWISNVWRRLLESHSIDSRVVVEFERHPPTMLAIRCLQTFSVIFHVFVSHVKIATFEFFKPLKALWFTKSMLTVNFGKHSILQQFSSNGNRKSMLSTNCNFQAQNSTCSTLLQTILLYETCIVVSWKSLSEQGNGVNDAVWR